MKSEGKWAIAYEEKYIQQFVLLGSDAESGGFQYSIVFPNVIRVWHP